MLSSRENPILKPSLRSLHENAGMPNAVNGTCVTKPARKFARLLQLENAVRLIEHLPKKGETLHAVCNGNFACMDLLPALLTMTGSKITRMFAATLSFSKSNVDELASALETGDVAELWFLFSSYFRATSQEIAEYLRVQVTGKNARFGVMRTHAKVLAMEFASGHNLTVETSANFRSSGNYEQFAISNDRKLLQFHAGWIRAAIEETNGEAKK